MFFLRDRVSPLEEKVSELEDRMSHTIYKERTYEVNGCKYRINHRDKVPIEDIVLKLVEHLGLEITVEPSRAKLITLKEKKDADV